MAKILVHVTHGPESPSRVALAFLAGRTAAEEGHEVTMFLVADAVYLVKPAVIENLVGVGLGKLSDHVTALKSNGARFYVSKMSAGARDVTEEDLTGVNGEWGTPSLLVKAALEHDRMFTY